MGAKKISRLFLIVSISLLFVGYGFAQAGRGKGRINGVVVNEQGNSIKSATIVIEFAENKEFSQETTADENGEWAFIGLGTGTWRVTASADGYISTYQDIYVRQLERNPKITLTLKKIQPTDEGIVQDESSLSLLEEANQLFTERKYDESIALFEQFLEKNPDVYQTHLNIGDCYREKGEVDKAVEEYNKVLEEAKKDDLMGKEMAAKALAATGECYLKKGDFEAAQGYFEQSIELYSDNEILAYNVGEIYFSNQKIDEAIHYFTLSTQIKPEWGPPYLKLGYSYLNKGEYEQAKQNLNRFLELDPESPEAPNIKNVIDYLEKIKK